MSKNSNQKVDKHLRHCIITSCGDANAMMGTKHIDPVLCKYLGAYLMCIDNKHLTDKKLEEMERYVEYLILN